MRKVLDALQIFGKSFMGPVVLLPIVGLIIAIGNILANGNLAEYLPVLQNSFIQSIGKMLSGSSLSIFGNLALIFAVGIPIGLAKKDKAYAGLSALFTFIVFIHAMNVALKLQNALVSTEDMAFQGQGMVLGVQVPEMGVFSGILVGTLVGILHNKYSSISFKGFLDFYSGHRFVVILSIPLAILIGFAMTYIWPYAQTGINGLAGVIKTTGPFGVFLYGFLERALIPTGLHHLVYTPFLYTELGGTVEVGGHVYNGARNIFFAELADPNVKQLSDTIIWDTKGLSKMFGLVGAALAMYVCADKKKKDAAKAILLPAAITSFLLGITEPLEFSFLFTAPLLFGVHAVLAGLGMMTLSLLNVHAVAGSGIIDFVLYNIPLGLEKSNWLTFLAVGISMTAIYFFIFRFLILKLNLATPGREKEEEIKLYTKEDYKSKVKTKDTKDNPAYVSSTNSSLGNRIVDALGGEDNLKSVENCITRLRVEVEDISKINESALKSTGSQGVIKSGNNVQVVYGLNVSKVREQVDQVLQ
ncbi:PTS transporter subunit EIIC [Priestia aryabhattai]|uniref:PTS transporter subunit EIIC n=1 Tax=Priestia TaxID=2800373 RepID=UPI001ADF9091|nr:MULTISPECIES: PTS transporter subunit EIIC [Priestia]MDT0149839.1 PTS transporter subunit EIIC [Priestia aryabhattai]MDT0155392.1 PTS transporter subunit EIIC [Priestia aryabhattai]